jgi:CheY-like chemotaxis protein
MRTAPENREFKNTILWVDDEEIALEVWARMLQKLGYDMIQAHHGRQALEIFKKHESKISLVLLDMKMPGMNGCEIYDRLKEIQPEIKIILVSGYIDQYVLDEMSKRNFNAYIEKPFKLNALSAKIKEVLDADPHFTNHNQARAFDRRDPYC